MSTTTAPSPNLGTDTEAALRKRSRMYTVTVGLAFLFVWQADIWLATPDAAVALANKTMGLVGSASPESPVWLRVGIAAMLALGLMYITTFARAYGDETQDRFALTALKEKDPSASRQLRLSIWAKRGMKITVMALLGVMFAYLFSFDVERARLTLDMQELESGVAKWESLGLKPVGDQAFMAQAVPAAETSASLVEPRSAFSSALPSVVGYALLWLLHGVLLMMPMPLCPAVSSSACTTPDDRAA